MPQVGTSQVIRFATFEVDLRAHELRKSGVRLRLTGQAFQVLAILLEHPGLVVTREELQKRLWPDTFVDVDHSLNTAINKIREVLGDSAESPRYVETVPRQGYRFIAPLTQNDIVSETRDSTPSGWKPRRWLIGVAILLGAVAILAVMPWTASEHRRNPKQSPPVLTRLTFDEGLQVGGTWSPDARYIAYSSDRGGKFDIWVQQLSGGDPVQITKGPGQNWQPDWSPDGRYIVYRSEQGEGGIFMMPVLGGAGHERRLTRFGYYPRWSPDGKRILFQSSPYHVRNRFHVMGIDDEAPKEILKEVTANQSGLSAAWHPDGSRVTARVLPNLGFQAVSFWTAPVDGGKSIKTELTSEMAKEVEEAGRTAGTLINTIDSGFSWSPSGNAFYFDLNVKGATNIWRLRVDPETLQASSLEQLTTGTGTDMTPAISPDGKKVLFTGGERHQRGWLFPMDANRGSITGTGHPVTEAGLEVNSLTLSKDGTKLAFCANRAGKWEMRGIELPDGTEVPIVPNDSFLRGSPRWSPDGNRLVYTRSRLEPGGKSWTSQLAEWSNDSRKEEALTSPMSEFYSLSDWSPDGKSIVVSQENQETGRFDIWVHPIAARPRIEQAGTKIVSNPGHYLLQSSFSPDGKWVVFEAIQNLSTGMESSVYVASPNGGPWTRIGFEREWGDKPRWSPDGKTIYVVSSRAGFFNVFRIRFDPTKGKPVGEPFQVTTFDRPSLMVGQNIPSVDLSIAPQWMALTVAQTSGSLWMLEKMD